MKYVRQGLVAAAAVILIRYHVQAVERANEEGKRTARRSLIDHLRQNRRGTTVLDMAFISQSEIEGPLTVLGDDVVITGCYFTAPEEAEL